MAGSGAVIGAMLVFFLNHPEAVRVSTASLAVRTALPAGGGTMQGQRAQRWPQRHCEAPSGAVIPR